MPNLTLDETTLLTIRAALWHVRESAGAADQALTQALAPKSLEQADAIPATAQPKSIVLEPADAMIPATAQPKSIVPA